MFYYPELSKTIVDIAYKIHKKLGVGLFENTYEACFMYELEKAGCIAQQQVVLPLTYETLVIPNAYRIDILVEDAIILELKSVEKLSEIHFKQLMTYLKLSDKKVGYLINFNEPLLMNGLYRKVL